MHYLVDGYNLLFRRLNKGESVQNAREAMIESIGKKVNFIPLEVTLVFDSVYQPGWASHRLDRHLEVIYTNEGETADEWLIRYVKKMPEQEEVTIVTSDKRLAVHLKGKGVKILSSEEFVLFLNKRVKAILKTPQPLPSLPVTKKLPTKKIPKGSVEYYEKIFEDKSEAAPPTSPKKAPKKLKEEDKRSGESELERWQRLFGA
jgi:predicted RNA-binding protein with PIN domain